jgi:hypothetical protein
MSNETKDLAMVHERDLELISTNAAELNAKAMLLTDAWGAMFILDADTVKSTIATLGMSETLGQKFYDKVRSISVVNTWGVSGTASDPKVFTWHMLAASLLTVRGEGDLGKAMAWITNDTLESFIHANADLLKRTMALQPDYAKYLLFSPKVAANVLGVFGARVGAEELLRIAKQSDVITAEDAEGRRGIACKFARSLALVIASKKATAAYTENVRAHRQISMVA